MPNRKLITLLIALFLIVLPLLGQQAALTVMAGARLRVKFDDTVGTAVSRRGDGVEARLLKPLEAQGREALPVGTVLTGRVVDARPGNKHTKTYPMIRLEFTRLTLPDRRSFAVRAGLADLGAEEYVDSEGVATTQPPSKAGDIAAPVTTGAAGAGVGAIAGGAKGAEIGAGAGAALGALGDLAAHLGQYDDFTLSKGRKAWLRLDADLVVTAPSVTELSSPGGLVPSTAPAVPPPATAATAPAMSNSTVYIEPVPKARFNRVNEDSLRHDLRKAGILFVEEPSQAGLLLRVWDDFHGFHGELTDRKGIDVWAGSAATCSGLARGIARYMQNNGLLH